MFIWLFFPAYILRYDREGGCVLLGTCRQRSAGNRHGMGARNFLRRDGRRVAEESARISGGSSHGEPEANGANRLFRDTYRTHLLAK